jgi:hypothetical protein
MRMPPIMSWRGGRPRVKLIAIMGFIALVAVGLRLRDWGVWLDRVAQGWEDYLREKALYDAWNRPIAIRVTRHDDLETVLLRLRAAMAGPRMKRGPYMVVDTGGLRDAGQSLGSAIQVDIDTDFMQTRDVFDRFLKPMGLGAKLQDGMVMVVSAKSPDEPLFFGHHGEVFCNHGECVPIRPKLPGP